MEETAFDWHLKKGYEHEKIAKIAKLKLYKPN